MASWAEVERVHSEHRHELVLSGENIATRIQESGLDERIFKLLSLNFLEISKCGLRAISEDISRLANLTNLVFHGNQLTCLPDCFGQLQKLKYLDVSNNELNSLPDSLGSLKELQTLNASCNKLSTFIDPSGMVQLHVLDLSHNSLGELPDEVGSSDLALLGTLLVNNNQLQSVPATLCELPGLKLLDVSDNKLTEIPASFCECGKLREFKFGGNKLKDRRLAKMMGQCSSRAVLDYLRPIYEKERKANGGTKGSQKGGGKKDEKKQGSNAKDSGAQDEPQNTIKVIPFKTEDSFMVQVTPNVISVRPYIVCIIVRNLNFDKSPTMMKRFITLQTRLHETICNKRQAATIATHDLDNLKVPLVFDARPPADIRITPLHKKTEKTASSLVAYLRREAEELRKEKKRNTLSGIHKYLDLLKGKELYPCLVDSANTVISFPPITNSNVTKVTSNTRNILVEITSSQGLDVCKKVMEELLANLLLMGIGMADAPPVRERQEVDPVAPQPVPSSEDTPSAEGDADLEIDDALEDLEISDHASSSEQILVVQQVKVLDTLGNLKVIYPSRVDLQSESYRVDRDL